MKLLKNQKESIRLSSVLVPILTGNESKEKAVEKLKEFDKIILLLAVDSGSNIDTTRTGTKIKEGEQVIEDLQKKLNGKEIIDNMQWGDPLIKIKNTAMLYKTKNIMLVDTQRMKKDLEGKFNIITVRT